MQMQEQVQNLMEFLMRLSILASTSPCFTIISIFLLNASSEIDMKHMRNR